MVSTLVTIRNTILMFLNDPDPQHQFARVIKVTNYSGDGDPILLGGSAPPPHLQFHLDGGHQLLRVVEQHLART